MSLKFASFFYITYNTFYFTFTLFLAVLLVSIYDFTLIKENYTFSKCNKNGSTSIYKWENAFFLNRAWKNVKENKNLTKQSQCKNGKGTLYDYGANFCKSENNNDTYFIETFPAEINTTSDNDTPNEKYSKQSQKKGSKRFFTSGETFSDLNIHTSLVEELKKQNITAASIIQLELLKYFNNTNYEKMQHVIMAAENGLGKTFAYIIFILNYLLKKRQVEKGNEKKKEQKNCVLIFQPNDLLCDQCYTIIKNLSKNAKIQTMNLKSETTINAINCDLILIASPGRFNHFLKKEREQLETFFQNLRFFIIDEADVVFEKPYQKYVNNVLCEIEKQNKNCKFLLASATISTKGKKSIYNTLMKCVQNPKIIKTDYLHNIHPFINYYFFNLTNHINDDSYNKQDSENIDYNNKLKCDVIKDTLLRKKYFQKILIFCNTVKGCKNVYNLLSSCFESVFLFNSSLTKEDQILILENFKRIEKGILVTTDIIYRGINIQGVTDLFHFDTPTNVVIYTHRNGRISRGGTVGNVYIFKNMKNLVIKKLYAFHKNEVKFNEIFSRKRSLRREYKRLNIKNAHVEKNI